MVRRTRPVGVGQRDAGRSGSAMATSPVFSSNAMASGAADPGDAAAAP
jgi:hypothetical protein